MYGNSFFGRYFGDHYFGPGADVVVAISLHGSGSVRGSRRGRYLEPVDPQSGLRPAIFSIESAAGSGLRPAKGRTLR